MSKKNVLGILATLVFAAVAGYFIYANVAGTDSVAVGGVEQGGGTSAETVSSAEQKSGDSPVVAIVSKREKEATETAVVSLAVPDLNREIVISGTYSDEQKEKISSQINDLSTLLKQDPSLFNEWLDLGLHRKVIEDYEGAREAWEYASAIRPQNSLSYSNLGVLYGYYLGNAALAEKNYLKALENDPKLPYLYAQAADFYLEVMNNKEKARNILEKGLKEVPGDEALKAALGNI